MIVTDHTVIDLWNLIRLQEWFSQFEWDNNIIQSRKYKSTDKKEEF